MLLVEVLEELNVFLNRTIGQVLQEAEIFACITIDLSITSMTLMTKSSTISRGLLLQKKLFDWSNMK